MRVPFNQLRAEAEQIHRLYGNGPHHGSFSVRQIAAKLGRTYGWTWRRWRWHQDMEQAHAGFVVRANRLPMRGSRNWDTADFERRVAQREKIRATVAAHETLADADQARRDAAASTRNAEKARRDEGREWTDAGADPSKVPEWVKKALAETPAPPESASAAPPERPRSPSARGAQGSRRARTTTSDHRREAEG